MGNYLDIGDFDQVSIITPLGIESEMHACCE